MGTSMMPPLPNYYGRDVIIVVPIDLDIVVDNRLHTFGKAHGIIKMTA
jgi:hypothetical protein